METGEQLGGLYKKATYLEEIRKSQAGLVVVDGGDLLNEDEEIPESVQQASRLKADLIARIYKYIGVDAVNVGELDLVLGVDYLKELEKNHGLPLVSANLVNENDEPIFKRYVVKTVNGKKIGILGLMGDTSEMASKVGQFTNETVSVADPLQAAAAIVKELSGKVDYLIALTHQGTNRDWVLARRVPGIDLVVNGHDKQKTKDPYEAEKTLMVQAGEKNQYQGILEVSLDGTRTAANTLVPYGDKIADDPKVKAMISEYNDKIADLYGGGEEGKKTEAADVTLRASACEPCHASQVKNWKTSDHAKAYSTLVSKSKQFDPKCLACHTTRFEQPEGFSMKDQQPELRNIQCESCHGWGKEHMSEGKPIPLAKPGIELCRKCHTPDRCPELDADIAKLMEKIKH